jgi:Zn-dependent peptidase ImmA (M78 family)
MNEELLMDLADCGSPEKLIAVILKHHPAWTAPVPVEELAAAVNIVKIAELEVDGFEGSLQTDAKKTKGVILYKAGARDERRRFTIAHELGHFLMPSHVGNQFCTAADLRETRRDNLHQRQEAEANRFAAGLLIPKPWFVRDMAALGEADVTHVQTLGKQYRTSLEATSNRYTDLTDDCCAFVFAKDGVIRYVRSVTNFPRLAAKRGDPLPSGCASLRAPAAPLRIASAWAELDGSTWLQTEWGKRPPKILEQTMRQRDGHQVTLLFIPTEESDDVDDNETELERGWEVGFRKR